MLFHYDGWTSEWHQFEWSKRAIHVSIQMTIIRFATSCVSAEWKKFIKNKRMEVIEELVEKIHQIEELPLQEFHGHTSDVLDLAWSKSNMVGNYKLGDLDLQICPMNLFWMLYSVYKIRYLLLARMLRLIRLLMQVQRYRAFVATFLTLIPSLMPFMGIIFCILCIYCSLGLQIFGGLVNAGNPKLEGTDLSDNDYLLFNFNDYPNGMVTLFNLLIMGN
ncbi:two pore calcium channel protein 1B-like [Camellia sinensis]|uniref:two pore calcium channel protein 1B-like n=1 Tax=Camellia sinensis TaxID=4442 RepID=UPI00103630FA|nr:two pore calcium channel protein 1B-like [Camellia sinensis]